MRACKVSWVGGGSCGILLIISWFGGLMTTRRTSFRNYIAPLAILAAVDEVRKHTFRMDELDSSVAVFLSS